jgi:hypothetical protein
MAGSPGRGVLEVCQPMDKWKSKYQFPAQALQVPRSNLKTTEDTPNQGLRMSSTQPPQFTRERRDNSTFSFSSSPFDEFQRDAGPSRRISEANTSTVLGLGSGSHPKSKLSGGDEGNDIQGSKKIVFPRQGPRKERDDHSHSRLRPNTPPYRTRNARGARIQHRWIQSGGSCLTAAILRTERTMVWVFGKRQP